ncbi:DUF3293 domain-containing protein [Bowmanella yangjiangensis]|uniref:DUF3293 domain-containing protein n=1 Tax=Bowmanella yangjiangensis TaxID=2811230 RepID=A0ABS3CSB1_9ALTE|nr:DUF3293 domain-containing protein [Bowmanella yangjiangensis]MBN7819311.1 DUF3293 domain-containing protein [Bowmanella yangjiangensis]
MCINSKPFGINELWTAYQQTVFLLDAQPALASQACILNACNPLGQVKTAWQNKLRQQHLADCLMQQNIGFSSLSGASPDLSYQEASFLIACDWHKGIELAGQFAQNAPDWLGGDDLWLLPVLLGGVQSVYLGSFTKRCRINNE